MPLLSIFSLVLTMFFWGGTFIAGRLLADSVPPACAAFLRFAIASLLLLFILFLHDGKLSPPPVKKWFAIFLLGLTGVFLYNILFFTGLRYIEAGRASLIIALNPLVISILAHLFLNESYSRLKLVGILLSLGGALFVISNGQPSSLLSGGFGPGETAILGCVASWSAYSLIGRTVLTTISPLAAVCYSSLVGTFLLLGPALKENIVHLLPTLNLGDWLNLSYLGICGTALGFSLYYKGIQQIGATRAGIFINLVPVFSILLSCFFLHETIKLTVIVGGILVLTGITITNMAK